MLNAFFVPLSAVAILFAGAGPGVLAQQQGYGYSQIQPGGFLNSADGCHSYYQGSNYGPQYKRELQDMEDNHEMSKRDGGLAKRCPVYQCQQNYPYPYPSYDYSGGGVPGGLPPDFQFYGNVGWTAPQHWKAPTPNYKPNAETAKALAKSHWYNPADTMKAAPKAAAARPPPAHRHP
ncbi:hypothetical protein RQP46_005618 [Phenoliferia psychrophenolica]